MHYSKQILLFFILGLTILNKAISQVSTSCSYETESSLAAGNSNNGYAHTPKGNLHVLILFVTFSQDDNLPGNDELSSFWPKNDVPDYAATGGITNDFLDIDGNSPSGRNNLSKYYQTMSGYNGSSGFSLSGKIFHVQIDKSITLPPDLNKEEQLDYLEKEYTRRAVDALKTKYSSEDWSVFDQRTNNPHWGSDNSGSAPDGKIDYFNICFRLPQSYIATFSSRAGYAKSNLYQYKTSWGLSPLISGGNTYTFLTGHTLLYGMMIGHHIPYFLHEFSHNLYNSPHYFGANSATGIHYYQSIGWGMMGGPHRCFTTANAWEKWYLGWLNPQVPTSSSTVYVLKDFVTQNDAIRIPIPNTGGALWLENHQLLDVFDQKVFLNDELPIGQGIYAYISYNDNQPGENHLRTISAQGNWDYSWSKTNGVIQFTESQRNDISGQCRLQAIRGDFNNDMRIQYEESAGDKLNEQEAIGKLNGVSKPFWSGANADAFHVGDEISLSGNVPVVSYPNYLKCYEMKGGFPLPYKINGISVKILSYNSASKEYTLEIKINDFEVRNNKRWSAKSIDLYNLSGNSDPDLIVKSGVSLLINKSKTPNTDLKDGLGPYNEEFSNYAYPTTVTCKLGAFLKLENGSNMVLDEGTILKIESSSRLELGENAVLLVKNGSTLNAAYCNIHLAKGAKIIFESGGKFIYNQGVDLNMIDLNSCIEMKNTSELIIENNATFQWTGPGYLKINNTSNGVVYIKAAPNSNNATFFQSTNASYAGGYNKKVIEVVAGTLAVDKNLKNFKLINGTIWMGTDALVDVKSPMAFLAVKMKPLATTYKGVQVYGQQETPYLDLCVIDNADIGLNVLARSGEVDNTLIKFASVKNTNFNNCRIGVQVNGKAAQITGGKFWQNKTGIFLSGVEYTSTISSIEAYGNRSAIDVVGTGYDMLETKYVDIYSNVAAGAFIVKSMIRPTCSQINNNYPDSNPFNGCNILLREYSTLNVEPYGIDGKDGGKSSITNDKSHSVVCVGAKELALHYGKTNFTTNAPNNMAFYGTLRDAGYFSLPYDFWAHKNIWNSQGTPPIKGTDYNIEYYFHRTNSIMFSDIDGSNTISPDEVDCILPPTDWDGRPSQLINPCPKLEADGDDFIILDGLTKMYHQTPDYISAISDFAGVVTKSYQTIYVPPVTPPGQDPPSEPAEYIDEFSDCNKIIEFAYQTMLEALGKGIGNGSIENLGEITSPVQTVIDAQDALKDYYIQYENGSRKVFEINLEQALIYRLINDRQTALEKLGNLHESAETDIEQNLLSYYECLVTNEIILETSEGIVNTEELNDCVSFLSLPDVELEPTGERPEDPVWEEGYGKRGNEKSDATKTQLNKTNRLPKETSSTISVYPNPANDFVNVKLPSGMEASEIRILDITGRLLQSYHKEHLTGIIGLDVQLANGTYFIEIINESQPVIRRKIMIVK